MDTGAWVPSGENFSEIPSPSIENYNVDRTSVPAITITPDMEDSVEYVIYTPKTIWVTYVDPDGTTIYLEKTTEPKAATGQKQEEPDAPADPTKDGYTFEGWDRTVDENGNITYVAKWEPVKTYWVTYVDPATGRTIMEKTTEPWGADEPPAPADPTRDGYTFDGWDRTVDADGNVTYTAKWKPVNTPEEQDDNKKDDAPSGDDPAKEATPATTPRAAAPVATTKTTATTVATATPKTSDTAPLALLVALAAIAAAGAAVSRRRMQLASVKGMHAK